MLLTSGQVSVAISSFIVFFFTTALFLSGYVLQQQTVRDLREAIKPQFQAKLVGLDVSNNLNMNADRSGRKGQVEVFLPKKFEVEEVREDDMKVEIKRDMEAERDGVGGERKKVKKTRSGGTKDWSVIEGRLIEERLIEAQKKHGVGEEEDSGSIDDLDSIGREERGITVPEKPLSRAERRRKIKEDLLTSGEGETFTGYRRRVPVA